MQIKPLKVSTVNLIVYQIYIYNFHFMVYQKIKYIIFNASFNFHFINILFFNHVFHLDFNLNKLKSKSG
jgi:hypothetical protein